MDESPARKLNQLARHQMYVRILKDIKFDITVCRQEGWDYREI